MDIKIDDLTKGITEGTGAFDVLMRAANAQVEAQYNAQRISGAEYGEVYLGTITAVLNSSVQYLLGSARLNKELLLLEQQIEAAKENVELVKAQIANINADTALKIKQLDKLDADIGLTLEQTKVAAAQLDNLQKDLLIKDEQIAKTKAETALIDQNERNAVVQGQILTEQVEKTKAENNILAQKLETEKAQTQGTHETVGGILGKQMLLFEKQAEGFDRNAEQKLAKILVDTWTVRQTTDGADVESNGLIDSEINKVLNKAKEGIGVAVFDPYR